VQQRIEERPAQLAWVPWPHYEADELEAVRSVLESGRVNYWTGEEARLFEAEYAAQLARRHAIALANGSVALELALLVLGVGPGDEIVTSPRTFIASAAVAALRGAKPVLADVDPDSGNITAETVAQVLTPRTRAIIAVHLGGWPCDMAPLMELARSCNISVVEDCAQAHGAQYQGRPAGSLGDLAAFSFCQDKIISTGGEGGLLAIDDEDLWKRAWAFKDHGKSHDAVYNRRHPPGFRWLHESFGTNWRMTEMQAAIGRKQLGKLDRWVQLRNRNANILYETLRGLEGVRIPLPAPNVRHAYYRFYCYLQPEALKPGWTRDRVLGEINQAGVRCTVGSCGEIHRERAFVDSGLAPDRELPVAHRLAETSLAFEVHPTLNAGAVHSAGERVAEVVRRATR
jgi:dTDP-4-amino-4,6-dideoxygalactose transaminase